MKFTIALLILYLYVVDATNFKIEGAGDSASLLLSNGKVTVTGNNNHCALGLGYTDTSKTISTPEVIFHDSVVDIACTKGAACCAVKTDGKVYCWGRASGGQLGDGQDTTNACSPQEVANVADIDKIDGGFMAFHARKSTDGTIVSWGKDVGYGETGLNKASQQKLLPQAAPTLTNVANYYMYERGGIAVLDDGSVYGTGDYSMWGDTDTTVGSAEWSVATNLQTLGCVKPVGGIQYNSYCLTATGQVITMGYFGESMLIRGTDFNAACGTFIMKHYFGPCVARSTTDKTAAGIIDSFDGVVEGHCTSTLCYWLKSDGSIWMSGDPDYTEQGVHVAAKINPDDCTGSDLCKDGTAMVAAVKLDAWGTDNKRIDCTQWQCFVLKNDDTIKGIGANSNGELGTGDLLSSELTQANPIKTSLFEIAASGPVSCQQDFFGNDGQCSQCPAGSTNAAGESADCKTCNCKCEANHYATGTVCLACPANSAPKLAGDNHTDSSSYCTCNENFYGNAGQCTPCPGVETHVAGDPNTCTSCGCSCALGWHVEKVESEPGPEYVSINGVVGEKKLEVVFNKDLKQVGIVTGWAKTDLVITGTYIKPGGVTYPGYKWDAQLIPGNPPFNPVLSMHDTESAAAALCDNLCVGIDHVDVTSWSYDYTPFLLVRASSETNGRYCGPHYYTSLQSEVFCDGNLIEAKSWPTEFDGKTNSQIYNSMMYDGQIVRDYCKNLGNCGCIEPDLDGDTFTKDTVFRFYETNLCSATNNNNKVNTCTAGGVCVVRFPGDQTTVKKWRVIHGSVMESARVSEAGATAKTVGSPQQVTGPLSISYALNNQARKIVLTIEDIEPITATQTLLDTTTLTSIAYTNNNGMIKTVGEIATPSFTSSITPTFVNTECLTGNYPCYRCAQCDSGFTRLAGDRPSNYVETTCIPSGPPQDCSVNQYVLNFVCTDCPSGTTNPQGASLTNNALNGAANNLCCGAGLYLNSSGTGCEPQTCAVNHRVDENGACVACSGGSRDAGDLTNGGETQCFPTPPLSSKSNSLGGAQDIGDEINIGTKIVDYDDDGRLDIIYYKKSNAGNIANNLLVLYMNVGTTSNPSYTKSKIYKRQGNNGFASAPWGNVDDIAVLDWNNDGIKDIVVIGRQYINGESKSAAGDYLLKGTATAFEQLSLSSDQLYGGYSPFHFFDINGDGYVDYCSSGEQEGVICKYNKADGTFATTGLISYRGQYQYGKYYAVAVAESVAVIQAGSGGGGVAKNTLELIKRSGTSWSHVAASVASPTTYYNDARWVDLDNDGGDELAVLTDNELLVYSFTNTYTYSYSDPINGVNFYGGEKIGSYSTEALAQTACDGDDDCVGIHFTSGNQWEAFKGLVSFESAPATATGTACRTSNTNDARRYLPKSCSDTTKEASFFHCITLYKDDFNGNDLSPSGSSFDYFNGAVLETVEPTSLSEVPATCQFDSVSDAEDPDKIETCLLTAGNLYVQSCAANEDCTATQIRTGKLGRPNGHKQIGAKWVLVTVNLKRSASSSPIASVDGCSNEDFFGTNTYMTRMYKVETNSVTPKLKKRTQTKVVSGFSGQKITEYTTCGICDTIKKRIIVADILKEGKPQLILTDMLRKASSGLVVHIRPSVGRGNRTHLRSTQWTAEITKLETLVPSIANINVGQMTDSTFTSLSDTAFGTSINGVPGVSATSVASQVVKYPLSCDVNERAVNGICEPCSTGSTSAGVTDPTATPNTGCTKADNLCLENEYVKDNKCFKCIAPETNAAGDDATGANTKCDCVNSFGSCMNGVQLYTGTCIGVSNKNCSSGTVETCSGAFGTCDENSKKVWTNFDIPSDGNMSSCEHPTGYEAGCICNGNMYAKNGACRDCPAGATANLVNYDPSSGDTVCLCQGAMGSDGTVCVPCPVGKTNYLKDYDPTSGVKECMTTNCQKDFHVVNHVCVACPHNSQRLPGDDPAGPNTRCHCKVNSKVIGGDCIACEVGSTNPKLCYASKEGGDTYCTCNENYYAAASKVCTECPANSKNEAGDYAGDGPTYCNCKQNYHVESGVCKKCQDNSLHIGGDELDEGDTYCTCAKNYYASSGVCTQCPDNTFNDAPTKSNVDGSCKCNANFKVKNNACVACELNSKRAGGSLMSGPDTYCVCGVNEKVSNNECVACEAGSSFPGSRDAAGADNECICNAGYQKNSVTKLCEICPAGTHSYSPHGADAPCLCKPNHYVQTVGTCVECPVGSISDGGNPYNALSTCTLLPGYFVDAASEVKLCPDGSTSTGGELINGGQTKCKTTDNHYVDVNGDVQDCPSNSAVSGGVLVEARATISGCICDKGYQAVGSACGLCPTGQTTDGTHRTDEAQRGCFCKEGFYVDASDHSCKECSVGGSTAEGGDPNGAATSCDCAENYRVNGNAECELCQPGETNAPLDKTQDGETQCDITKCARNFRVENHVCIACPTNMINEEDDPANSINTICDYPGNPANQYEFDVSGTKFLVQKKDGTNMGLNAKITLRIGEGPFIFSRQPASVAGDDLIIAEAVTWATTDITYDTYTQLGSFEAKDDVKIIVWNPNLPGTFYYLSKDTNTMVGEVEVTLPLCQIGTSGSVVLTTSCVMPNEIILTGDLEISVASSRRRFLRKNLKSAQVLVQAAANSRHFSVPAGTKLTINGLTLSDGNPGDAGGSILASGGSVVATGVTFKNNKATTGGAIEAEKDQANNEPSVSISSSIFDANEGTNKGGAINAKAGSFTVDQSTFSNNKSPNGDGGALAAVTDVTITGSTFTSNSAPNGDGGAVAVEGKKLTMLSTTLSQNSANSGGAVGLKGGEADLKTITIESNTATVDGGAILVDQSNVNISSSNIKENNGANGGGIKTKNMGGKKFEAQSNTFNGNKGTTGGGAFHFEDEANTDITIFESTFLNNKGVADEEDDMKSTGSSNIVVKVVDLLSEIKRKGMPQPDCSGVQCNHRAKSSGKARADGSCKCACDGVNEYEKDRNCVPITICAPGQVTVVNASDVADRICGSQTIKDKQAGFDAAGAALSSLVTNKLKDAGLGDSDAFNLAVDMVGGVNKC